MLSKLLSDMCQEYFSKELLEIWQVDFTFAYSCAAIQTFA